MVFVWGDVNEKLSRLFELSKCIHAVKEFRSCYIQKKYVNGAEKRHKIWIVRNPSGCSTFNTPAYKNQNWCKTGRSRDMEISQSELLTQNQHAWEKLIKTAIYLDPYFQRKLTIRLKNVILRVLFLFNIFISNVKLRHGK